MTKPSPDSPSIPPDQGANNDVRAPAGAPRTADEIRRGVLEQRKHIQDLDGEDPLRGGVAD